MIFIFLFSFSEGVEPGKSNINLKTSSTGIRFGRLITHYRWRDRNFYDRNLREGNFGDAFQGFAVENIFDQMGIASSNLVMVNRDDLDVYNGEQVIVPMQCWFGQGMSLNWSSRITPVFLGFHLEKYVRKDFVNSGAYERMKKFGQSIGCRDRQTAEYLKSLGIRAYFSGCLTLTLPKRKREPKESKIFIVDLHKEFRSKIPQFIRSKAEIISQKYVFENYPFINETEYFVFETKARNQLHRFETEARLVITSKIHVAMPCIALGIPVVFCFKDSRNEKFKDSRIDVLKGIVKIHTLNDVVNWNPPAPSIEAVKDLIRENAFVRIKEMLKYKED